MKEHDVRLRQAALHIVLADENKDFRKEFVTNTHWFRAGILFSWCVRYCAKRWDYPVGGSAVDVTWDRLHRQIRALRQQLLESA